MFYLVREWSRRINYSLLLFHIFSFFFVVLPVFIIVVYSLTPSRGEGIRENFALVNGSNFGVIIRSLWVSVMAMLFTFVISYMYSWFLLNIESTFIRFLMIMLVTVPLWSSFFVKLLGLKSFFDWLHGRENSTFGLFYVIVGLVYLNLPITILSFYGALSTLPKNLINASLDLGNNGFESIFKAVIPYIKDSIISSMFLVFINSFTAVTVADFLNGENGSRLIGQLFHGYSRDFGAEIDRSRLSVLTLFISLIIFTIFGLVKVIPRMMRKLNGAKNG